MAKIIIYILFLVVFIQPAVIAQFHNAPEYNEMPEISWPSDYEPADAKFFVSNTIEIAASPQEVWDILIEAERWPLYYEGASEVEVLNSEDGTLEEGSVFTWKTMGLNFESTIKEFEPPYRLSWESVKRSIRGYHAWLIIPTEEGCILLTEESQHGWLTFFQKVFQPNKLHRLHDIWLAEIKALAESNNNATDAKFLRP